MKTFLINPSTEEKSYFLSLNKDQLIKKVQIAKKAFISLKKINHKERSFKIKKLAGILRRNIEDYAKIITTEMGKPIKEARTEIEKCSFLCDYYSENFDVFLKDEFITTEAKKSYVTFEPLGVIFAIMPWNFPFWQVFRCAIPAICAGNVILLKHAGNVPQCALAIEKIFKEAGFSEGIFTALFINSSSAKELIEKDRAIQGISFTGSVAAGKELAQIAGKNLKKIVLELGGSDPFIVLEDAHIENTCDFAIKSRMTNGGQSCISAKRFIIVKKLMKEFQKKIVHNLSQLKVGNPLEDNTDIGPLAKLELLKKLKKQVNNALKSKAEIIYQNINIPQRGFYYPPTIISKVAVHSLLFKEEIFGPVFALIEAENGQEAATLANNSQFGLGASIWTQNIKKAEQIAKELQSGMVFINGMVKSDPRLPFGGIKNSGIGRELGSYGLKEFVNIKTIVIEK